MDWFLSYTTLPSISDSMSIKDKARWSLLQYFNVSHDPKHRKTCFKNKRVNECRFKFPKKVENAKEVDEHERNGPEQHELVNLVDEHEQIGPEQHEIVTLVDEHEQNGPEEQKLVKLNRPLHSLWLTPHSLCILRNLKYNHDIS